MSQPVGSGGSRHRDVNSDSVARLPATGPGSVAGIGRRAAAFAVDALASSLIAALFVALFVSRRHHSGPGASLPGTWSVVPLAVDYVLGLTLLGQTLGMRLLSLHLIRTDRRAPIGIYRAVLRTVLLLLLIPAVVLDRFHRGLHDRVTDTVVVNSR